MYEADWEMNSAMIFQFYLLDFELGDVRWVRWQLNTLYICVPHKIERMFGLVYDATQTLNTMESSWSSETNEKFCWNASSNSIAKNGLKRLFNSRHFPKIPPGCWAAGKLPFFGKPIWWFVRFVARFLCLFLHPFYLDGNQPIIMLFSFGKIKKNHKKYPAS